MPRAESSDLPVTRRVTIQSVTLRVTIRPRLWPVSYSLRTQCVALPEFGQNGGAMHSYRSSIARSSRIKTVTVFGHSMTGSVSWQRCAELGATSPASGWRLLGIRDHHFGRAILRPSGL